MVSSQFHYTKQNRFMPFLLAEILNFQGSTHRIGVGSFSKLKSDIVSMGKDVGDKVSDASAIAKVKLDIHNKESYMEKQFTELGRAYYLAHKNEENIPEKEFFRPIAEAEAEIARLQEQLMTLQGAEVCPNCGKKQPAGHVCCENCGAPMHETASAEEAATSEPTSDAETATSSEQL